MGLSIDTKLIHLNKVKLQIQETGLGNLSREEERQVDQMIEENQSADQVIDCIRQRRTQLNEPTVDD